MFLTPFPTHIATEGLKQAIENTTFAEKLAGVFYHFTDARITAWGRYSKVLVPRAAKAIRLGAEKANVAGWALSDVGTCEGHQYMRRYTLMGQRTGLTRDDRNVLIWAGIVCWVYVWLILKATGVLKTFAIAMGGILPAWFPVFNLIVLPALVPVMFLRTIIRTAWAFLLFFIAWSFCYTLIGVSYHRYKVATIFVHLLILAEIFWLVPKWRKARNKERSANH